MRNFVVMFDKMPITRSSVKSGKNSPEVITACRCINIGLFVSGDLRRDVTVSFAIGPENDLKVVSFPGASLKRVSPDERSISFFLLKSIERVENLEPEESFTMDNGIELTRTSLEKLKDAWGSDVVKVPLLSPERFILDTNLAADDAEETP
ncbi:MAG: hypothetical protein ACFFEE_08635 [Candidatus Thorarchaeota archaeon]